MGLEPITLLLYIVGVNDFNVRLIGLGADGASVNVGTEGGIWGLLRKEMDWLAFIRCMCHRIELGITYRIPTLGCILSHCIFYLLISGACTLMNNLLYDE